VSVFAVNAKTKEVHSYADSDVAKAVFAERADASYWSILDEPAYEELKLSQAQAELARERARFEIWQLADPGIAGN
jgi:hypothetical protein